MSVDSFSSVAGWEGVSSALQEIRNCQAETWTFFHGLFEDLNSFGESLEAHKRNIDQTIRSGENDSTESAALGERFDRLLAEREAERQELRQSQEVVQNQAMHLASVAADLAAAQNEFQANFKMIRDEIALSREAVVHVPAAPSPENGELERKLTDLERQHAALEQDRAVLEKELEGVRNRAADLAESLAEQKRLATQQQSQGNAELQRMRVLLESLARQKPEIESCSAPAEPAAPTVAKPAPAAQPAADPVLGSVLAQFEMLQQDRAKRRA